MLADKPTQRDRSGAASGSFLWQLVLGVSVCLHVNTCWVRAVGVLMDVVIVSVDGCERRLPGYWWARVERGGRGNRGLGQTTACNTYSQLSCRMQMLTDCDYHAVRIDCRFPVCQACAHVCCSACKLNQEDAVDRSRWRKLMKDVWWSGWMWVGECFFWYWPTRVVPDKGSWNGCVCVCSVCLKGVCSIKSVQFRRAQRDWITDWGW